MSGTFPDAGHIPQHQAQYLSRGEIPISIIEPAHNDELNSTKADLTKSDSAMVHVEAIESINPAAEATLEDASSQPNEKQPSYDWQLDDSKPVPSWRPWPFNPAYFIFLILLHTLQAVGITCIWMKHYSDNGTTGSESDSPETWDYSKFRYPETSLLIFTQRRDQPSPFFIFSESSTSAFFAWQFLPVACTICVGLLWSTIDVAARRLEPFYRLSLPNGASALETISEDYMSCWVFLLPLKAGRRGHWTVAISSFIIICNLTVLPTLHGGMWKVSWVKSYWSGDTYVGVVRDMNVAIILAAFGLHMFIIFLATILGLMVYTRRSGLYNDPGGITALASLICESPRMLDLLCTIPSYSSQHNINVYLQPYRFKLQHLTCRDRDNIKEAYQIVPILNEQVDTAHTPATLKEFEFDREEAHPVSLRGPVTFAVTCLTAMPLVLLSVAAAQSTTHWPTWSIKALLTFMWTVNISFLELQERDLRIMQPYYQAQEKVGLLGWMDEFLSPAPFISFFKFVARDAALLASVNFINFANQVLVIFIPPSALMLWDMMRQYGAYAAVPKLFGPSLTAIRVVYFTLGIIVLVNFFGLLKKRRKPIVPRKPDTISSNLVYICKSCDLLNDVRDLFKSNTVAGNAGSQVTKGAQTKVKEYGVGWFKVDGRGRVGFAKKKKIAGSFQFGEAFPFDENE